MAPEPIQNTDGSSKQDCERNAGKRLIQKIRKTHPKLNIIIAGDGLYSNQPLIDELKSNRMPFVLVAKPGNHKFLFNDSRGYIDEQIYINTLYEIIGDLAEEGNCVIVGRGGQYILRDHASAFHVLLVAEHEDRVKFMMEHYNLTEERAEKTIRVHGKRRRNLYRKFGKESYDEPDLYHLVLNMSKLSMEKATDITCNLIKT